MSIERAIEKAKERNKLREAEQRRVQGLVPAESGSPRPVPELAALERPLETYLDFGHVNFDPDEAERHRILLAEVARGALAKAEPSYRMLRSRVRHRIVTNGWSCVGITSPGPGEGKTVTSLNLALSMSREKQRPIFLLDLDMRNPSVFKYVGVHPPVQISEYLQDTAQPEQVLFATSVESLVIAGNREPTEGASELLATGRLKELLSYIHRRFPSALVLIDLPPVTSTDEALQVAPCIDAMFLVVGVGKTRRDALTRALDLLSDFNVSGMILNRTTDQPGSYYYGPY